MGKKYNFSEDEIKNMVDMYLNQLEGVYNIAKKYGVDESVIKNRLIKSGVKIAKGSPYSIKYWNQRGLSDNESKEHIKTLRPVNKEYWIKNGYTEEEAILQIEGQKMVSLRGCIARFGKEEGTKAWDNREDKRSDWGKMGSCNIGYWVKKGYSKEEAKEKVSKRQKTFSKEICIKKYGEEEGLKIFTERQNKWQKTLYKNGKLKSGYSEVSQELFYKLIESVDTNNLGYYLFAKKGGEFILSDDNGFYRYDFTDLKSKRIIEYNGDDFHGNPYKYSSDDKPNPFRKDLSAQDIWDRDIRKTLIANNDGFEVFVVWDSEYKKNKEGVINKCKKFLEI